MKDMFESLKFYRDKHEKKKIDNMGNMLKSMIEHIKRQQAGSSNAPEVEKYMVQL